MLGKIYGWQSKVAVALSILCGMAVAQHALCPPRSQADAQESKSVPLRLSPEAPTTGLPALSSDGTSIALADQRIDPAIGTVQSICIVPAGAPKWKVDACVEVKGPSGPEEGALADINRRLSEGGFQTLPWIPRDSLLSGNGALPTGERLEMEMKGRALRVAVKAGEQLLGEAKQRLASSSEVVSGATILTGAHASLYVRLDRHDDDDTGGTSWLVTPLKLADAGASPGAAKPAQGKGTSFTISKPQIINLATLQPATDADWERRNGANCQPLLLVDPGDPELKLECAVEGSDGPLSDRQRSGHEDIERARIKPGLQLSVRSVRCVQAAGDVCQKSTFTGGKQRWSVQVIKAADRQVELVIAP